MKARVLVPLALVAAFLSASCENFDLYNSNLFKQMGLGQVSSSALAKADSATITQEAYASDGTVSEAFISSLSGSANASTKAAVLDKLSATYSDPASTPAQVQESAALAATIEIKTTDTGGDIVNNVSGVISTMSSSSSNVTASSIIKGLFTKTNADGTTTSLVTAANAAELAAAFDAAGAAYDKLGKSLTADSSGTITSAANLDMGTTAQMALISMVVASIDYNQVNTDTNGTYADKGAVLLALADGSLDVSKLSSKAVTLDTSSGSSLSNILAAAGMSIPTK